MGVVAVERGVVVSEMEVGRGVDEIGGRSLRKERRCGGVEVGGGLIPSPAKWAMIAAIEVEEEVSSNPPEGVI